MIELYTAPENIVFSIALTLMFMIGIVQIISLLLGLGLEGIIDDFLPDFDVDAGVDVDVDADFDLDLDTDAADHLHVGFMHAIMGWLHMGKVPALVSFIYFLFIFPFSGYAVQIVSYNIGFGFLPGILIVPTVFIACMPLLRIGNQVLAKIYPKDETSAVSSDTFIGRVAVITLGQVTSKRSAEAKLVDQYGKSHYIMVLADNEGDSFQKGDHVLVVGKRGSRFSVITNPNPNLED